MDILSSEELITMAHLRQKTIKGGTYWYEEECNRVDGKPVTKHVRYIGKSLQTIAGGASTKKDNVLNMKNSKTVPQKPGVYYLYNRKGHLIYIGAADKLRHRISAYHQANNHLVEWEQQLKRNAHYFRWRGTKTKQSAFELERTEIKAYNPRYNHYKTDD